MEILAPAGSWESLDRAQAAGADAVYLGYAAFSARAGAGNFDEEQLKEALAFAHLHHMRVYVTVNTLVKDAEMPRVEALLRMLNALRVDGVLVQDLGVLRLARRKFPGLRIHASTQMAIHNAAGVNWCARMGMKRVVLARECSLDEIRKCAETGVEIEAFGHGAQCVSVSGECLFSSMVGERSGNRGRCAQPCRKTYRFDGVEGAWLSPRDLCLRDRLPELREAGIASLKIEGRLKRPEYVYTVTESYRRGLRSLEAGHFLPSSASERENLRQIFDRGGFMEGYAFGAEDDQVIQPREVNHQGIRIGKVISFRGNLAQVHLERDLHDGDGLRIRHGSRDMEMTYAGKTVVANEIATLRLREEMRAAPGDEVFRLVDTRQLARAMEAPRRKIPVDMELTAWQGQPLTLKLSDGEERVTVAGEHIEAARTRESTAEELERQLRKTGGTDFEVRNAQVNTAGAFVPVSAVNELRRQGLAELAERRMEAFAWPVTAEKQADDRPAAFRGACPMLLATVRTGEQAEACRRAGAQITWYPEDFREEALTLLGKQLQRGDWLRLPEVCEEKSLQELHRWVREHAEFLGGVVLGSVGQLGMAWAVPIAAGPGIPVMNRDAARLLAEEGCQYVTASPELSGKELRKMLTGEKTEEESKAQPTREGAKTGERGVLSAPEDALPPVVLNVYGRTQLMLLHHCPARTVKGLSRAHGACALCDRKDPAALRGKSLEDERGYHFPLQRVRLPEGCLIRLLNCYPTDLGEKSLTCPRSVELTIETREETEAMIHAVKNHERAPGESTRGHWMRPVL